MKPKRAVSKGILFRLSVKEIVPEIWRRLLVSSDITLERLHSALQVLMGWGDRHLYAFVIDEKRYSSPSVSDENLDNRNGIRTKLSSLVRRGSMNIAYEYDFGDRWQIVLSTEPMGEGLQPGKFAECIGGSRHGPIEDSGGSRGYMEMAKIYGNSQHKRYHDVHKFIGPNFDPESFDLEQINARLRAIA